MKYRFTVGVYETHSVVFRWNQLIGQCRISVDGKVTITSQPLAWEELATLARLHGKSVLALNELLSDLRNVQYLRKWQFEVGTTEKHLVTIIKVRPEYFAAFRQHRYAFFVDGQLIYRSHKDFLEPAAVKNA